MTEAPVEWLEHQAVLPVSARDPAYHNITRRPLHPHALIEDHDDHRDDACPACNGDSMPDSHICTWRRIEVGYWRINPTTGEVTIITSPPTDVEVGNG